MDRFEFRLPEFDEGSAQAEIVSWHVAVGDLVNAGQLLVVVETDGKAVKMRAPVDGAIVGRFGNVGETVPVGGILVEFGAFPTVSASRYVSLSADEKAAGPGDEAHLSQVRAADVPASHVSSSDQPYTTDAMRLQFVSKPPLAAPAARRRAFELGISLKDVKGSGPFGRILPLDLDHHIQTMHPSSEPFVNEKFVQAVGNEKIESPRHKIVEKIQESMRRIPHYSYIEECDVTALEALRQELNQNVSANKVKLTLLPFLMRAMARILASFPNINARYDDDAGILNIHDGIHIGISTQTQSGLVVPVVRHVESRSIWSCARELVRVCSSAREGNAKSEDLSGSTITLTSLGALGGLATTPIINHPEVAVVGPNKITERAVVQNGRIVIRKMMNLSTSFDYRIVDGYEAARFVQALKRLIENPALIFVD